MTRDLKSELLGAVPGDPPPGDVGSLQGRQGSYRPLQSQTRIAKHLAMMIQRLKSSFWIFDIGFRPMAAEGAPGWAIQMLVFSALALLIMGDVELGVPTAWPLIIIGIFDLAATQHFARGSFRRIRRLGWLAPGRARWWIKLSALDWTLCMSGGVFALTHGEAAVALPA